MSKFPDFRIDNQWIESQRGGKNRVVPNRPYHYFVEKECIKPGTIDDVSTILLTNNECSFRCVMCDLWKNTTDRPVEAGAIPTQINYALSRLPLAKHLKLYNSGNFFDSKAIPPDDYEKIARLVDHFETVIVESHPVFIGKNSLLFHDLLKPALQVAIGLETVHPEVLPRLNKHMTLSDFEHAVSYLNSHGISTRAFILLRPPFLSETEGVYWTKKSIDFAFRAGVAICSVIPVRSGNGALDVLAESNYFSQPDIKSLERVIEYGIGLKSGIVIADLWDIDRFSSCHKCVESRKERLNKMNLSQRIYPQVECSCSV
jgi:radical SAM enzyme (TIGR01210 family)